jgi:hypothetical protein
MWEYCSIPCLIINFKKMKAGNGEIHLSLSATILTHPIYSFATVEQLEGRLLV